MSLKVLLQNCKKIVLHPVREYRRIHFKMTHAKREPHDIICRVKDFSLNLRSDSVLAEPLYIGKFEEAETKLLCRLAEPGMKVIDVGANIGIYTILLGKAISPSGHLWSIEPFPPVASYLKKNIALNELNNITFIDKAVAEHDGMLDFHVFPEGSDVYNSLGAAYRPAEKLKAVRVIPVSVTTLDIIADKYGIDKIDILKIDVEGAEERVLKGAERLIRRSQNVQIVMEIYEPSSQQCGCSLDTLVKMLEGWGFSMFEISSDGTTISSSIADFSGVYALFKR